MRPRGCIPLVPTCSQSSQKTRTRASPVTAISAFPGPSVGQRSALLVLSGCGRYVTRLRLHRLIVGLALAGDARAPDRRAGTVPVRARAAHGRRRQPNWTVATQGPSRCLYRQRIGGGNGLCERVLLVPAGRFRATKG